MLLSRLSELSEGGCATHRSYEVRVAEPSLPARGDDNAFAVVRKIGDVKKGFHGIWVELSHHGAHGNLEHKILTVSTVFARALAMGTALGAEVMLEAVVDERREARKTPGSPHRHRDRRHRRPRSRPSAHGPHGETTCSQLHRHRRGR